MKKIAAYIMVLLLANILTVVAFAQPSKISGNIVDSMTNESIADASVKINGTASGVSSNSDGTFSISGRLPVTLIISAAGYIPQRVLVDENTPQPVTIKLLPDSSGPVVEVPSTAVIYKIGDTAFCGVVFYIFDTTIIENRDSSYFQDTSVQQNLLICSFNDQAARIKWHNGQYITTGTTRDELFNANTNTDTIIYKQGQGAYAASVATSIQIDYRNYDSTGRCSPADTIGWYLPSRIELRWMYRNLYANLKTRLKFAKEGYWSSVELAVPKSAGANQKAATKAWIVDFLNGRGLAVDKANKYHVRAIRKAYNKYKLVTTIKQ